MWESDNVRAQKNEISKKKWNIKKKKNEISKKIRSKKISELKNFRTQKISGSEMLVSDNVRVR